MGSLWSYALYWAVVGSFTSLLNRVLPDRYISRYSRVVFRKKIDPKFYENRLHIKSWKDKLPEMSRFDKTVFDKSSLKSMNEAYIKKYMKELDKGLFAHSFPVIFLLPMANTVSNDAIVWFNALLLSVVHLPFLAILRYNQARMGRLLEFLKRKEARKKKNNPYKIGQSEVIQ